MGDTEVLAIPSPAEAKSMNELRPNDSRVATEDTFNAVEVC